MARKPPAKPSRRHGTAPEAASESKGARLATGEAKLPPGLRLSIGLSAAIERYATPDESKAARIARDAAEARKAEVSARDAELKVEIDRLRGRDPLTKVVEWYSNRTGHYYRLRHDEEGDPTSAAFAEWSAANPGKDFAAWFASDEARTPLQFRDRARALEKERSVLLRSYVEPAGASKDRENGAALKRGLLAALQGGHAVAFGRDESNAEAHRIPAHFWKGEWSFDTEASSAAGGVPIE